MLIFSNAFSHFYCLSSSWWSGKLMRMRGRIIDNPECKKVDIDWIKNRIILKNKIIVDKILNWKNVSNVGKWAGLCWFSIIINRFQVNFPFSLPISESRLHRIGHYKRSLMKRYFTICFRYNTQFFRFLRVALATFIRENNGQESCIYFHCMGVIDNRI